MEEDTSAQSSSTSPAEATGAVVDTAGTEEAKDIVIDLWSQGIDFLFGLLRPWNAYQVGIAAGLFILAFVLSRLFGPRLHDWMRTREGWPKWRMRFLVLLHRRLTLLFFVILVWPVVWTMQEITWPSRS